MDEDTKLFLQELEKKFTGPEGRKTNNYPADYIKKIRDHVKITCKELREDVVFNFSLTRDTPPYIALYKLLQEKKYNDVKTYPKISTHTLHEFFNSKPTEINGELQYRFKIKTVAILAHFSIKYGDISTRTLQRELDNTIKNVLFQLSYEQHKLTSVREKIYISEKGACMIDTTVVAYTFAPLMYLYKDIHVGLAAGEINVLKAVDLDKDSNLKVYSYIKHPTRQAFFLIFEDLKRAKSIVRWETRIFIETLFISLIKGKNFSLTELMPEGREKQREVTYIFPNTALFKKLKVKIEFADIPSVLEIKPKRINDRIHFHILYDEPQWLNVERNIHFIIQ